MVFSSIPVYLDPPNWHQQQSHHQQNALAATAAETNPQLPPLPPPPPLGHHAAAGPGSGSGSIRPGSMADRARLAKIPQPEAALKCPRCESTNTKFCYFNNYSLAQPRHFCKTCRRYWTRGGALRSVPVGGGCRRNKKTKSGNARSKSPAAVSASVDPASNASKSPGSAPAQACSGSSGGVISPSSGSNEMIGHFSHNPHTSFMASIQNLARFGGPGAGALGLGFCEIQGDHGGSGGLGFQIGPGSGDQGGVMLQGEHQWRLPQQQHFPLFGGGPDFDSPSSSTASLYPFHQGNVDPQSGNSNNDQNNSNTIVGMMTSSPGGSRVSQFPPVKLEGRQGLNMSSRPGLGVSENSSHFWAGNSSNTTTSWTDLTGLNSASMSHLL